MKFVLVHIRSHDGAFSIELVDCRQKCNASWSCAAAVLAVGWGFSQVSRMARAQLPAFSSQLVASRRRLHIKSEVKVDACEPTGKDYSDDKS
jgi:hypothetical protein